MYCTKCGKWTGDNATLCKDCQAAADMAAATARAAQEAPPFTGDLNALLRSGAIAPADPENKMFGFGRALASTIVGTIGFIVSYMAMIIGIFNEETGIALVIIGAVLGMIALVDGVVSIAIFRARCALKCSKPVATLVLGIVGLVSAALALLFAILGAVIVASGASIFY